MAYSGRTLRDKGIIVFETILLAGHFEPCLSGETDQKFRNNGIMVHASFEQVAVDIAGLFP